MSLDYKVYKKKLEELVRVLKLRGALISDSDGLPIASYFMDEMNEDAVCALSAHAIGLAEQVLAEIKPEPIEQLYLKSETNLILINKISDEAYITLVGDEKVNFGQVLAKVRAAVVELQG